MYTVVSRGCFRLYSRSVSLRQLSRRLHCYFNSCRILQQKHVSFHRDKSLSLNSLMSSTSSDSTSINQCIYLTDQNAKKYMDNYDTILLDCDGVLWGTDHTTRIDNIGKALKKLRDCGKQLLFVTNNSLHSQETFLINSNPLDMKM